MIASVLLDARTPPEMWARAVAELSQSDLVGIDCETQDEDRHAGLNAYNNAKRHVFDHRRTTMTGFSLYADGSDTAWYVNLGHADEANRIDRAIALDLLSRRKPGSLWLAHNAPFELVMFAQCLGVDLPDLLCTLQMAVSHHSSDEYNLQKFFGTGLGSFAKFTPAILTAFANYDADTRGRSLTDEQQELLSTFIGKESKASHSYNGFVTDIAIGYNLKKLVKSLFDFQMTTYEEVLKAHGAEHMGELTGEQVVAYGADDAYWCVQVFKHLRDDLLRTNPLALQTFIEQENPMVRVYADSWREGIRLNLGEVYERRELERQNMARTLREFKAMVQQLLPFDAEPDQRLIEKQPKWYAPRWQKKREQIVAWAMSPDTDDDFAQCFQVSNPVGNAWALEQGIKVPSSGKLNLVYYEAMRTILWDLMKLPLVYIDGEISSDKEARGKMLIKAEKAGNQLHVELLKKYQRLSEIEQVTKLYLTPYTQLMDPDTSRIYSVISSMLASRRMGMRDPNGMQLSKQGETVYVRGFYLADSDDHVVVSADWSSVELVEIGDFSGDPGFREVFGQLPYGDLHSGAAADCLAVKTLPGLTEEEFREFKFGRNPEGRMLRDVYTGVELEPAAFYKHARGTPVGKGANFNYWYSGSLSTVGANLGWTSDEMWEAVDRYRSRFPVAEAWRVSLQQEAEDYGFITLPDGHRRVKYEATEAWGASMLRKFADLSAAPAMLAYGDLAIRRLRSRAKNQVVNSMIQGSCATLAKRTIVRMTREIEARGWNVKVMTPQGLQPLSRFMMPIHDETVWSVHRDIVMEFLPVLRAAMTEHPTIIKTLPLDCTVAIGKTFKPFDKKHPVLTQIELDEAMPIAGVIDEEWQGKKLPDDLVARVVQFIADAKVAA